MWNEWFYARDITFSDPIVAAIVIGMVATAGIVATWLYVRRDHAAT